MKKIKKIILGLIIIILPISSAAASGSEEMVQENSTMAENAIQSEDGTPVILEMNGTEVGAVINTTLAGREFLKMLPYSVSVSRAADDLCGTVREELPSDPSEGRTSWKIGEIGWFGGWFTILVDHEEKFSNMPGIPIIGKINDEDMSIVKSFKGRVDIKIRLAEIAEEENTVNLYVGDTRLTAELADNSTAEALKKMLADGPVAVDMRDYGSMEKVGTLPKSLPRNDEQITTEAGDLILYQGNAFVIYYAPNSWNFTRIGKIKNISAEELKKILGKGNVTVKLSLD